MNKKNEKTFVPKLRFPEFRDCGKWKERPIRELLIEVNRPMDMVDTEDYSLVTVKRRYGGIVTRGILKGVSIKVKSQFYIQENDFLISKRQIVHNACDVVPKELAGSIVSNEYSVLKATQDCDIAFFKYFSQQPIVSRSFLNCSIGIHIEKMLFRLNDWFKQEFLFPAIKEQKKIADCLTSLDELIIAETQKLEAYKAHKKGLMQKLFPAEEETVPGLRFPEFRDAGEWVMKIIGQVAHYENGKAHEQDIIEQGTYIVVNSKFISTDGEVKKHSDTVNLLTKKGDILMVLSDVPNGRAIAKCFYVDKDNTYTVNQRICKLTPKKTVGLVLYYVINRNNYLLAFDDGVKQTNLKKDDVLNCPIVLPNNPKEQNKIADCLSSLDELITAEAQKLDTLKAYKKGLMQGLFPSADEVSV